MNSNKPFKLKNKDQQFLINTFFICAVLSLFVLICLKWFYPNKRTEDLATTISGFLGTGLSFFGSVLVYHALKAQIKANKLVQDQIQTQENEAKRLKKIEYLNGRIALIKEEINTFNYSFISEEITSSGKQNYQGSQAILKLLLNSLHTYYGRIHKAPYEIEPKLNELHALLLFFKLTLHEIKHCVDIDENTIKEMLHVLKYLYESKIRQNFESIVKRENDIGKNCTMDCGWNHGLPESLKKIELDIRSFFDYNLNFDEDIN